MAVKGFTLVEISVSIILIGLIVGGIAVGAGMLETAKLRKVYGEFERFSTAAKVFQNRYNCVPGDCPNAYLHFGATCGGNNTTATGCNGNGNTLVDDFFESHKAWRHLSMAKLLTPALDGAIDPLYYLTPSYVGTVSPRSVWSNDATWFWHEGIVLLPDLSNGWPNGERALALFLSVPGSDHDFIFSGQQAFLFDSKFDDGLPDTGNIHADHIDICTNGLNAYTLSEGSNRICFIGIGNAY